MARVPSHHISVFACQPHRSRSRSAASRLIAEFGRVGPMFNGRFRSFWVALSLVVAAILAPSRGEADVLAQSTFDTDSDGWVVKDLPFPSPGAPPAPLGTFTPTYHATGGNLGGYLSLPDPTGNAWSWYAPPKFLGNKQAAYGGRLSFDLSVTGTGTPFDEEDVILVGGG